MPTILGVNFGCEFFGGPEALEKQCRIIHRKKWLTNSLRNRSQFSEDPPDKNGTFTPIRSAEPAAKALGKKQT